MDTGWREAAAAEAPPEAGEKPGTDPPAPSQEPRPTPEPQTPSTLPEPRRDNARTSDLQPPGLGEINICCLRCSLCGPLTWQPQVTDTPFLPPKSAIPQTPTGGNTFVYGQLCPLSPRNPPTHSPRAPSRQEPGVGTIPQGASPAGTGHHPSHQGIHGLPSSEKIKVRT